jgi:hypothetical protein
MDKELVTRWLRKQCSYESVNYIFHNAFYDVGWLTTMDIDIRGKIIDTLIAAPLVDENRFRFDLNSLAKDYLQESKSEAQLYEAAKMWGLDPKSEMWKLPASHVGTYAEQDAAVTLRLWHHLKREITSQNLINIFELETDLFPVLFQMKRKGVKVDLDKAEVIKMIYKNKKINSWDPLKNFLEWMSKSGLPLAWQRRSIVFHCHMIVLQQDNQSLTRTFLRHMIPLLLKWLWNVVRLTKREQRSSTQYSSIRTEGGFMLRSTKCVRTKEER